MSLEQPRGSSPPKRPACTAYAGDDRCRPSPQHINQQRSSSPQPTRALPMPSPPQTPHGTAATVPLNAGVSPFCATSKWGVAISSLPQVQDSNQLPTTSHVDLSALSTRGSSINEVHEGQHDAAILSPSSLPLQRALPPPQQSSSPPGAAKSGGGVVEDASGGTSEVVATSISFASSSEPSSLHHTIATTGSAGNITTAVGAGPFPEATRRRSGSRNRSFWHRHEQFALDRARQAHEIRSSASKAAEALLVAAESERPPPHQESNKAHLIGADAGHRPAATPYAHTNVPAATTHRRKVHTVMPVAAMAYQQSQPYRSNSGILETAPRMAKPSCSPCGIHAASFPGDTSVAADIGVPAVPAAPCLREMVSFLEARLEEQGRQVLTLRAEIAARARVANILAGGGGFSTAARA